MREVLHIHCAELPLTAFLVTYNKRGNRLDSVNLESILDLCLSIHNHLINGKPILKNVKQHEFLIKNLLGMVKNFCINDTDSQISFKERLASGKAVNFEFSRINQITYEDMIEVMPEDEPLIIVEDKTSIHKSQPKPLSSISDAISLTSDIRYPRS